MKETICVFANHFHSTTNFDCYFDNYVMSIIITVNYYFQEYINSSPFYLQRGALTIENKIRLFFWAYPFYHGTKSFNLKILSYMSCEHRLYLLIIIHLQLNQIYWTKLNQFHQRLKIWSNINFNFLGKLFLLFLKL